MSQATVATPRLQAVAAALRDGGFNLCEVRRELRALSNASDGLLAGLSQREEDGVLVSSDSDDDSSKEDGFLKDFEEEFGIAKYRNNQKKCNIAG
tara:strand:+ start:108 stop:392 length:285 start_codon:yes stop_codon:yes gene_type:complete